LSLDSANAQITGTIDATANTTTPYATLITASDGVTSTQQTISWSVSAEQLTLDIGDQSNSIGDSVSLPLSTSGAQGPVSFTADDLPPGLVLDSANAQITGTIDASANTTTPYATLITASDGVTSMQQTISWSVSAEQLTLDIGDQSNTVGDSVSLPLSTSGAQGPVTFTATDLPPAWSSIAPTPRSRAPLTPAPTPPRPTPR